MQRLDAKTPTEAIKVEFDFLAELVSPWLPGIDIDDSEFRRPTVANGFAYQGTAGQTGNDEPVWPTVVDATVEDGGVTWTAKASGTNGRETISTAEIVGTAGITVGSDTIDGTVVSAIVSGGTADREYELVCRITTSGGQTLELAALQPVKHAHYC